MDLFGGTNLHIGMAGARTPVHPSRSWLANLEALEASSPPKSCRPRAGRHLFEAQFILLARPL